MTEIEVYRNEIQEAVSVVLAAFPAADLINEIKRQASEQQAKRLTELRAEADALKLKMKAAGMPLNPRGKR